MHACGGKQQLVLGCYIALLLDPKSEKVTVEKGRNTKDEDLLFNVPLCIRGPKLKRDRGIGIEDQEWSVALLRFAGRLMGIVV